MLFNSYIFIFIFLPLSLLGYFLLNHIGKYETAKYYLIGMSLWFYAYFNPSYLWIILASILVNYLCHLGIVHRFKTNRMFPNLFFTLGITFNLGLLFYFKYFNFFMENINRLFHTSPVIRQILLPLGISFFTFQQIAFLTDTKKGEVPKQPLSDYMLFVTFFPQLIAGPIVSHREMLPQFKDSSLKAPKLQNLYTGFYIFVQGLAKKVLLADTFGQAVNWGYENYQLLSGFSAFLVTLFYTFQIYFDFSGYCDMARGIGYLFNIKIPVNFSSPYKAENIQDFWNRWHITLTRFFTGYVYIPLGGNRKGQFRTCINVLIVFLVSGIWHGAGYTFILWGLIHGVLSVLTRLFHLFLEKFSLLQKKSGVAHTIRKILAITITFLTVNTAWIFFRAENVSQAVSIIKSLFLFKKPAVFTELSSFFQLPEVWYLLKMLRIRNNSLITYLPMILFLLISSFLIWGCKNIAEKEKNFRPTVLKSIGISLLFIWCLTSLSGVSSFLYFNF